MGSINGQNSSLKVASYNIHKAVGGDWKQRPDRILNVISEIDADIIALQEVDRRLGSRPTTLSLDKIKNELGYEVASIAYSSRSLGWHGNTILFKRALTLVETTRIKLPTLEPRGAIGALFSLPGGRKFQMIATHLSLIGYMRRRQIKAIMSEIDRADEVQPTLIAGDFNEWRVNGKACRAFSQKYRIITPGASYPVSRPRVPLDRFALKGNVELIASGVHLSPLSAQASDHLPIYMDVNLT